MKTRKLLATMLVVVLLFAFSSSAFAASRLTITANSPSSKPLVTVTRHDTRFGIIDGSWSSSGSATKLTVRAYVGSVRNSNAMTFKSGSLTNHRDYWDCTPTTVTIYGNTDATGSASVSGDWTF